MPPADPRHAAGTVGSGLPAVDCEGLVVEYGPIRAVDGLSFSASAGEVLAILGPNGAGKTSTIECLEGYRRPSAGRLRVLGVDPGLDHRTLVPRIGVMLQRGGVYPMLSPRRVLDLFAAYYEDPEDPRSLLDLVDLTRVAGTPWRHLSGGEQQRLSLAMCLVGRPDVVFLDEPTAGVDPEGRLAIRAVVAELADRGVCVLLTTHELAEAEKLADRVVIVHRGRAVAAGSPAELSASVTGGPLVRFGAVPGLDTVALSARIGSSVTEESPGRYQVAGATGPELTAALTAWLAEHQVSLTDLSTASSLEDAYLAVVGEASQAAPHPEPDERPKGRRAIRRGGR
jgi:ABC-2 type transport system ATP-binding protein